MELQRFAVTSALVLAFASPAAAEPPTPTPMKACHDFVTPDPEGPDIEGQIPGHSTVPIVRISGVRLRGLDSCRSVRRAFRTVATFPRPVGWRCDALVGQAAECRKGTRVLYYRWRQVGMAIVD